MRTSSRRLLVVASAAVILLAGCTRDDPAPQPTFPTDGTLTPADLPDGEWTGPYEDMSKPPGDKRVLQCPFLGPLWEPAQSPVKEGSAAWGDGSTVVWSVASEFTDAQDAQANMDEIRMAQRCVRATPDPEYQFTIEDDGATILAEERTTDSGLHYVIEFAARQVDASVVGVLVTYPADAPPEVTAAGLLDRAVEVSADLQPVD